MHAWVEKQCFTCTIIQFITIIRHDTLSFVILHVFVWSSSWTRENLRYFLHILNWPSSHALANQVISLKSHISKSNAIQFLEIWYSPTLCNSNKSLISYPDASHPLIFYAALMPRDNIACHFLWWKPFWSRLPVLCNKTQNNRSIRMCSYHVGWYDFHSVCLWNKALNNTEW